jgi:hypothetical protein
LTNVGAVCPAPPVAPVTVFNVTPNGSVSYTINGTVGSPTLTLARGTTYTFNVSSVGHPFNINTINTTGTASQYNDGITNNNITSGTLTFVVGASAPSTLYYNCAFHTNQGGVINVIDAPARFSSASVANGFKVIAYPNPSSSEFTIETSAKGAINVKVYDMHGRLVEKADTNKVGARLAAGTYNVIVNQGTNNKSVRVIKK